MLKCDLYWNRSSIWPVINCNKTIWEHVFFLHVAWIIQCFTQNIVPNIPLCNTFLFHKISKLKLLWTKQIKFSFSKLIYFSVWKMTQNKQFSCLSTCSWESVHIHCIIFLHHCCLCFTKLKNCYLELLVPIVV